MYKHLIFEKISLLLVFVLLIGAVAEPWIANDMYNPDLLVLAKYISTELPTDFISALSDNTLYVYIVATTFDFITPITLVNILQNISVCFLGAVLVKYLRPSLALAIVLLTFFTIFLNQFRLAMALALCIIAMQISPQNLAKRVVIIFVASLIHLFTGAWFFLFAMIDLFVLSQTKQRIAILFVGACLAVIALTQVTVDLDLRYFLYFVPSDSPSQTFLLAVAILLIMWSSLNRGHKGILLLLVATSVATYSLASVSGRIAELACISIVIFSSNRKIYITIFDRYRMPSVIQTWKAQLVVIIGLSFFIYRFVRWGFMGGMEIPLELLYY